MKNKSGSTGRNQPKHLRLDKTPVKKPAPALFDNLPELITPAQVALVLPFSRDTVYDWAYRPRKYNVPKNLFAEKTSPKAKTLIRRDVLKAWKGD